MGQRPIQMTEWTWKPDLKIMAVILNPVTQKRIDDSHAQRRQIEASQQKEMEEWNASMAECRAFWKQMDLAKKQKPLKGVKYYGFTLTVPKDLGYLKAVEHLRHTVGKIKSQKSFTISKMFGGWEAHKSGIPHIHMLLAVDTKDGKYPREEKIRKLHGYGVDWCKDMRQPARWQNYILQSCKDKLKLEESDTSYIGEPMNFHTETIEGEDSDTESSKITTVSA